MAFCRLSIDWILRARAEAFELVRIHLNANRWQRATARENLSHSLDLRELLRQDGRSHVVDLAEVVIFRGHAENHDRRIGRD